MSVKFGSLRSVLDEVGPLGHMFSAAGYRLYLVGGIVRDQWLGTPLDGSSDIDLTTDASPAEIKRLVTSFADDLWTQGEKFGTIGLRSAGRDYEITTHRAESYTSDSRKPIVSFGDDIDVDLSRRDFTVNAMAIELPDGDLVDPYGGAADLEARLLRTPLSAEISFTDDPLRMLRAARFAAKYELIPSPELQDSATELHQRIRIVAIERIGVELRRLLDLDEAPTGLRFLADTGLLSEVLAFGEPGLIESIEPRIADALAVVEASPRKWHIAVAAMGLAIFEEHRGVQALCQRLRLSRDDERLIVGLAHAATDVQAAPDLEPATLRKWIVKHGLDEEPAYLASRLSGDPHAASAFIGALKDLAKTEDVTAVDLLDGTTIMEETGMTPGPAVGQAHAFLQRTYFEHGPLSHDAQIKRLKAWLTDRETNS